MQSADMDEGVRDAQVDASKFAHLFDPWLTSSHGFVEAVSDNLVGAWDKIEPTRQRRLREIDRKNRDDIIRAVVANLAFAVALGIEPPTIGVSLRAGKQRKTRYDRSGFKGLPRIIELLSDSDLGLLTLSKSERRQYASAITPGVNLLPELRRFKFTAADFHEASGRETVWLRRTIRDNFGNVVGRELVDYADCEEADRYRVEIGIINSALASAALDFEQDGGGAVATGRNALHRVFNFLSEDEVPAGKRVPFCGTYGGRLGGGWWQNLPRGRRHAIRIKREATAELDFNSMVLRLAYAVAGVEPPAGDLYGALPGLSEPRWRDGVKKVVLAMLFRRGPLTRLPRDAKPLLPPGVSAPILRGAILSAHPALADVFEAGIGMELMKAESDILVRALLAMAERGMVGLGMHDGMLCAQSQAQKVAAIMQEASEIVTGYRLPLTVKTQLV